MRLFVFPLPVVRLFVFVGILAACVPATAGTQMKASLVSAPLTCSAGACQVTGSACTTNADCGDVISSKSKGQIAGTGIGKFTVKGVVGAGGTPVTTDGIAGTDDDYVIGILALPADGDVRFSSLKLDLSNGAGSVTGDLSSLFTAAGGPFAPIVVLTTPLPAPATCPGANSPAEIAARLDNNNCANGEQIGYGGISTDETDSAKYKISLTAPDQTCEAGECNAGSCVANSDSCTTNSDCNRCSFSATICATNADCGFAISPTSKIQVASSGKTKVSIKGMLASDGTPITTDGTVGTSDDYLVFIVADLFGAGQSATSLKLELKDGKGKISADLSEWFSPAFESGLLFVFVVTPPPAPSTCPGTNSAADIAARAEDAGCDDGYAVGIGGIQLDE
ncbi:MAG TPA: hypothetical protein VN634_15440 [Candidatus Limnocylindrales bacterium]|nr:hypothetical protein [Candidatus Limnocylindrales bacterium]